MIHSRSYRALAAVLVFGCEHSSELLDCGAGTMLVGEQCVPEVAPPLDAPMCPAGAHDEGGTCVIDTMHYEIRIAETSLGANGHTKRRLLAIGTQADGSPSLEAVVVGVDRASAGSVAKTSLVLGPRGAETYFTPCDQATAGCLGPATLTLALASAPSTVIAHVDVDLVMPTTVSTIAPCNIGGNVMYVDSTIPSRGVVTVTEATWSSQTYPAVPNEVIISVEPLNPIQGGFYNISFDTIQLGTPLGVRTYRDAERFHVATAGHPGMEVSGNGLGCAASSASFQVHGFDSMAVTISFELHCNAVPGSWIEGCVHVGP